MPAPRPFDPESRATLLARPRALARRLRSEHGAEAVYLFGSLARGSEHEGSDVDLLVVADWPGRPFDKAARVARLEPRLELDVTVVPPQELRNAFTAAILSTRAFGARLSASPKVGEGKRAGLQEGAEQV